MNEIDILKELEKLDDDIEPGFLSELKQQTPDELHSRIMNSIRMEAMNNNSTAELGIGIGTSENEEVNNVVAFKPRFRFNYKKYATLASAAVILAVVFIGGAKELLNQGITPDSISPTANSKTKINGTVATKDLTNSNTEAAAAAAAAATAAEKAIADGTVNKSSVKAEDINKQNTNTADNSVDKKSAPASKTTGKNTRTSDKALATAPDNSKTAITGSTGKVAENTTEEEDANAIVTSKKPQPAKGIVAATTVAPADDKNPGNSVASAGDTKVAANNTESNYKDYGDEDVINQTPNSITEDMRLASLENIINYELSLSANQTDIIEFVTDKGTKIAEGVFKLKYTDYNELNKLLEKNNILPKRINELETNDQLVTIKMILN